ncbi:MAG: hypothetical protein J6Y32_06465 [Bacteroidales bacterium]|nr:hypothetical protein [Bacteroidales bacterium]
MCNSLSHHLLRGLCCLLLGSLLSCNKANVGPLFPSDGAEIISCGFASSVLRANVSAEDEGVLRVPLYRDGSGIFSQKVRLRFDPTGTGSAPDDQWVDVDPDGVFSLSTRNVIFSRDALSAAAVISFTDVAQIRPGRKYVMRLELEGSEKGLQYRTITITVRRKLTFVKYADCSFKDECLFEAAYDCVLFKAEEAQVYRVMDPYTEGLEKEGYVAAGYSRNPPDYLEFMVDDSGLITYEPFYTGMLVPTPAGTLVGAYGYWPGDYKWGKDFSSYIPLNRRSSETQFILWPVYCLPDYSHGFLNEGAYQITITLK